MGFEEIKALLQDSGGTLSVSLAVVIAVIWIVQKVLPILNGSMDNVAKAGGIVSDALSATRQERDEYRNLYTNLLKDHATLFKDWSNLNAKVSVYEARFGGAVPNNPLAEGEPT